MNCGVTLQRQNTSGIRTSSLIIFIILKRITFEVAMENLNTCIRHSDDAWYFSMRFFCTSIQRQDTVIHFQNTALDHDDTIHIVFHVEFSDDVLASKHVELYILLIRFHI